MGKLKTINWIIKTQCVSHQERYYRKMVINGRDIIPLVND